MIFQLLDFNTGSFGFHLVGTPKKISFSITVLFLETTQANGRASSTIKCNMSLKIPFLHHSLLILLPSLPADALLAAYT